MTMPGCDLGHWPADANGRCPQCFEKIATPLLLSDQEVDVIAGLIRDAIRKVDRSRIQGVRKWSDYEDEPNQRRLALLERVYRGMGLDPADIERPNKATAEAALRGGAAQ